ncbi:methyl-accepting chemotaxis protein [Dactylosporangium sp. NPDC050588]|uniref:methyl-accepting chemotaxis protein n=1 Tax=Dactylosporangium sp. NPDC050588 TaxID=3157211 RepID=UPI0033E1AD72
MTDTTPRRAGGPLRWFGDIRIGVKITAALAVALLAGGLVAWAGLAALGTANANATAIYRDNLLPTSMLNTTQGALDDEINSLAMMAIATTPAATEAQRQRALGAAKELQDGIDAYQALGMHGPQEQLLAALRQAVTGLHKVRDERLVQAAAASDDALYEQAFRGAAAPLVDAANKALDGLAAYERTAAAAAAKRNADQYSSSRGVIVACLVAGCLIAAALGWVTVRRIVGPIRLVGGVLAQMADGDLTGRLDLDTRDEVGAMAGALNRATQSMGAAVRTLGRTSSTLAAAAEQLSGASTQIAASAAQTSDQVAVVASAADEVTRNVHTVSAGSQEMSLSIREISQNANEAALVVGEAVSAARATDATVSKLGESSHEIGNVVKTIASIAGQTNLLALNATIEAARAGEAGKGFAVVATEVKDLAQETARATEDISRRVAGIQADTDTAVTAIRNIGEIIAKINDYQLTIASAVEQQTATTGEMNRGVAEAAGGITEIAASIGSVAAAAQVTTEGVAESQRTSAELARMSHEVRTLVAGFRI